MVVVLLPSPGFAGEGSQRSAPPQSATTPTPTERRVSVCGRGTTAGTIERLPRSDHPAPVGTMDNWSTPEVRTAGPAIQAEADVHAALSALRGLSEPTEVEAEPLALPRGERYTRL